MESSASQMDTDNTQAQEREKLILTEDNTVDKILRNNYYFNCLSEKFIYEDSESENSDDEQYYTEYDPFLYMNFEKQKDRNYFKKANFISPFILHVLELQKIKIKSKTMINFHNYSFPLKISNVTIKGDTGCTSIISSTFNAIMRISPRVLERVKISSFKISANQFKRLIVSYKHVQRLELSCCKILVPEVFDLSQLLKNTQIEELDFSWSGDSEHSDWENNPQEYINLIQGLATSPDLKLSLGTIITISCGIENMEMREILDQNKFNNTDLSD
ncbi:unnamed protein product [Moneuplotes crassus]|uniref:Uncharacterized protein n=1 Tax=Euplotes crassus TaxID=5936 RepID=A0AAD1UK07_EUPCR|nr:unnamed protein product [Moneuplotes crassus]